MFSSSFGVLTLQYVPAVPQPDAKDRLSDDARVVSNRRRYLLEVDLRISNHSERPFCVPNLTFVPPIQHFQARLGGPTQVSFQDDHLRGPRPSQQRNPSAWPNGHEQIFVAKTRLSAHGGCDEKYRRIGVAP